MNIPQRYNNPINLKGKEPIGECSKIINPDPVTKIGWCYFDTPQAGWRAAHDMIRVFQKRGYTMDRGIRKWSGFYNSGYIKHVCSELRVTPDTPISEVSEYALAALLAQLEGYFA